METRNRHVPVRRCVICGRRLPKHELTRYVRSDGDTPALLRDETGTLPGRGYYLCSDADCGKRFPKYKGWRKKSQGVKHGRKISG
ncbi:YlxR family protein [Desulfobaculum sp.]